MLQQVMTNPGEIIFREVPVPEVKENQVLVKIMNIGVCGSDIHVYHGKHPFTKYPVTQGHEVSGEIIELGKNVTEFHVGQKVTIEPQVYCGHCYPCRHGKYNLCEELKVMGFQTTGTASEYFAVDASKVTPIAVIQGYVNMLDRWGKDDEEILNESIEALKNESQHMKELVEQLLFLARGDCGRNTLKKETLNLTDIIRQVCEESEMIDEHHKYHFKGSEELLMEGDLSMLKQSVRIFTDNAAKYSEEGHTIVLAAGRNESGIYYSVQDEGTGIEEKDVSHVFDRFYRSDEARNSRTGGTGLGLSIAHWIVEAHDGVIEIISRPGLGTRFTVRFPKQK